MVVILVDCRGQLSKIPSPTPFENSSKQKLTKGHRYMTYLGLPHVVQHSFDHGEENPPVKEEQGKITQTQTRCKKRAVKGATKIQEKQSKEKGGKVRGKKSIEH